MGEKQQILYMQTRLLRRASEEWNLPMQTVATLFARFDVFSYIEKEFGLFHVEGDDAVLEEITAYLKNREESGLEKID
ncbi:MAG: DUF3791 domain-containing protein [Lachnospiraceae bacterium]|nr:DUF3791 domain-containing protein [Lachnospiraceae bacterium]